MPIAHPSYQFQHTLPYGGIVREGGVQFVIYSHSATAMRVLLYDRVGDREPSGIVDFGPEEDRWGDIWSVFVPGLAKGQLYHVQADGPFDPVQGLRFDGNARLIDPYSRALAGDFLSATDGVIRPPKCVVLDDDFDWAGDRQLKRDLSETVIYEMHVRGFTRSRTSGVKHPGTYLGLIEKIPYLQSLGVTAVELMPVHEFPVKDWTGAKPARRNYWGYDSLAFFAPHRGYAVDRTPGAQVREFKEMVRALHQAGIEVILDVVFNHTAEGNELGPTLGFKGLQNNVYYMLERDRSRYRNYSGCGNTVNGNHPIVREMIFLCLRHWVLNYHIDGFRFDLASILSRNRAGELIPNPPIVEVIHEDPLLANTKIIAEAWDAAGAYQVGTFWGGRWAEWNGRFRDDVRSFWRGDAHKVGALATRFSGSSDLYETSGRSPYHSINFVTSHDGFTLADLVSYAHKHNEANGEDNHDGENVNFSANYGVEGPTRRRTVNRVRERQIRNMMATTLLSHGVPMLRMGDECHSTQGGNNNAYCQDSPVTWFNWRLPEKHEELVRFTRALIEFRRGEPTVRRTDFLRGVPGHPDGMPDVAWFNHSGEEISWSTADHSLICVLGAVVENNGEQTLGRHVMTLFHGQVTGRAFTLPDAIGHLDWRTLVNTMVPGPDDVYPGGDGPPPPEDGTIMMESHSLVCFVAPATLPGS